MVGNVVRNLDGEASVDLKSPDLAIIVEVVRAVCCIGVAHNYFAKRKYNLVELVRPDQETGDPVKTKPESCEINSEISDGVEGAEPSDVKTGDSDKVERDSDNKVEGDSEEVTDSKGTPKINMNGNCEEGNTEEKGTKDEESC